MVKITDHLIPDHYNIETKLAIRFFSQVYQSYTKKLVDEEPGFFDHMNMKENPVLKIKEVLELSLNIDVEARVRMSEIAFSFYMDIYDEINFEHLAEHINKLRILEEGDRHG